MERKDRLSGSAVSPSVSDKILTHESRIRYEASFLICEISSPRSPEEDAVSMSSEITNHREPQACVSLWLTQSGSVFPFKELKSLRVTLLFD